MCSNPDEDPKLCDPEPDLNPPDPGVQPATRFFSGGLPAIFSVADFTVFVGGFSVKILNVSYSLN